MAITKYTTHNYKYGIVVALILPQPTRLTPQQLEEKSIFDTFIYENKGK